MNRDDIDARLVERLIAAQFPRWRHLPVRPVAMSGWDNCSFRLGEDLLVRLPSDHWYAPQVDKEQRWLPVLAPHLPLSIPEVVASGEPGEGYRYPWSILRWIEGEPASAATAVDLTALATALAGFLAALARVEPAGGPAPGPHNFWRGGPVTTYEHEARAAVDALGSQVPRRAALAVWDDAARAAWDGEAVWFHGDVAAGNLLLRDGSLAAVIDFGSAGVGDPACDVVIAWTLFEGDSREAFRSALEVDDGTWARGRGWALWKALIIAAGDDPAAASEARRVIHEVIADHSDMR